MNFYATIVGSRDIPPFLFKRLYVISRILLFYGYVLRSGGAPGSDTACDHAVIMHCGRKTSLDVDGPTYHEHLHRSYECYLPDQHFNRHYADVDNNAYIDATTMVSTYAKAQELALEIHPNPAALTAKPNFLALHARNMYQLLGRDLNTPSTILICYAPPKGESVTGGTRTAFEGAKRFGIPTVNIHPDTWARDRVVLIDHFLALLERLQQIVNEQKAWEKHSR